MKKIYSIAALVCFYLLSFSQNVGIGTSSPDASAKLDISSTNQGLLVPRVSLSDVTAFGLSGGTSTAGMVVYNTNVAITGGNGVGYYYWDGSKWNKMINASEAWMLTGNAGTTTGTNFIGTTDAVDFTIKSNNTERIVVEAGGNTEVRSGDLYIGNTLATNNDIYISNRVIDWDNSTYYLDPGGANVVNEVQGDNGSITDPSFTFRTDVNTGLFLAAADNLAVTTGGVERMRVNNVGNVGVGTATPGARLDVNGSMRVGGGSIMQKIQTGTGTIGSGSNIRVVTITFPSAFTSAPVVICTPRTQTGATYNDTFAVTTKSISTTSFQVNIYRVDGGSWGQNLLLDWIAIGL